MEEQEGVIEVESHENSRTLSSHGNNIVAVDEIDIDLEIDG